MYLLELKAKFFFNFNQLQKLIPVYLLTYYATKFIIFLTNHKKLMVSQPYNTVPLRQFILNINRKTKSKHSLILNSIIYKIFKLIVDYKFKTKSDSARH